MIGNQPKLLASVILATFSLSLLTLHLAFLTKANAAPPGNPQDWQLTFTDEFDGNELNRAIWTTKYGYDTGRGDRTNNDDEREWYVDDAFNLQNEILSITTKSECLASVQRPDIYPPYNCTDFPYTSGIITTQTSFTQKYGYFEIRMKVPPGVGFWPAFWLMPQMHDPVYWPPEIDIMENFGRNVNTIRFGHIYSPYYPNPAFGQWGGRHGMDYTDFGIDYSADYHLYSIDWEPTGITWYIDNVPRFQNSEHLPPGTLTPGTMYILINLAVGGGLAQEPTPDTVFPNYLQIDYVRVYQKTAPTPQPTASPPPATDLDGDNDTDLRDLLQFLGFFGGTGQGDFNNSGRVDVFDFGILVGNFGS